MNNRMLPVLLVIILFFGAIESLSAQINKKDSLALVDLYNSTNGPSWTGNTNWLTSKSVSTWYGISVVNNRVYSISLPTNNLRGKLPASIGNLTALHDMSMQLNHLKGELPSEIGNLTNVISISLDYNNLSGSLPSTIGNLSKLVMLDLHNNRLSGSMPNEIGKLTSLNTLGLYVNEFTGRIPASIGDMSSLTTLSLYDNQLSGSIPSSITKLTRLEIFVVTNNQLSGQMPDIFSGNPNLSYVDISSNHLTNFYNFKARNSPFTGTLLINTNAFTFDGVESAATLPLTYFSYAGQANIPVHQNNTKLSVDAGGTLANNTYRWYQVGTNNVTVIHGDSTFTPSACGSYYAVVTNTKATDLTLTSDTINYTQHTNKTEVISKISVYPNPVRNTLQLTGLPASGRSTITLSDVNGHVWMQWQVTNQATTNYNVSSLKPGNYLLHVTNGNTISKGAFIKQ